MARRVVVTGMSIVTALGSQVEEFWDKLCAGKSGIGRIQRFEQQLLAEMRSTHKAVLDAIRVEKEISKATEEKLTQILDAFVKSFA